MPQTRLEMQKIPIPSGARQTGELISAVTHLASRQGFQEDEAAP
jgi:hypothetical protein